MAKATSVLAKLLRAKRAVPISSNENEPLGIERPCGYHAIQFRNTDAYNLCDYLQNQVSSSTTKKWSEDDLCECKTQFFHATKFAFFKNQHKRARMSCFKIVLFFVRSNVNSKISCVYHELCIGSTVGFAKEIPRTQDARSRHTGRSSTW